MLLHNPQEKMAPATNPQKASRGSLVVKDMKAPDKQWIAPVKQRTEQIVIMVLMMVLFSQDHSHFLERHADVIAHLRH